MRKNTSKQKARKPTLGSPRFFFINTARQYSLIFALSPNDMDDLCTLYEKAGEINEIEQQDIINNNRGSAFVITGPLSRTGISVVASMDLECYMNALDDLGEVRYKNGIISEKLYLMILSEPEKSTRPHLETEKEVSEGIRVDISLAKARASDATKENELVTEKETERSEPEI